MIDEYVLLLLVISWVY